MNSRKPRLLALAIALLPALLHGMIQPNPPLQWWKGNLHTHTFWSDGNDFPEMVAEWYRAHGYNFLALSDHNILSRGERWVAMEKITKASAELAWSAELAFAKYLKRFGHTWVETRGSADEGTLEVRIKPIEEYRALVEERNRFIMIESEEITDKAGVHMNAINLAELVPPQGGATGRDKIVNNLSLVREQSGRLQRQILFFVNHPNYRWGLTAEDLAEVVDNRFFEVWNGVEGDNDPGEGPRPSTDEIWDIANALRMVNFGAPPLYGVATDDAHTYHGFAERLAPGRGWVVVRARHLTPESLIRAMRQGDYYASSGVYLDDVVFDGATLRIHIQACAGETYTTRFIGSRKGVNVIGAPRKDDDGNEVATTLDYGPAVGEVFAEVTGTEAVYTLRGDELYVRAVIVSDAQPDVPSKEFPYKRAWTQPVGWERWIE
jgi:hypothetical protein